MASFMNDILGRAEKLSSANYHGQISNGFAHPSAPSSSSRFSEGNVQNTAWFAGANLDSDLTNIFRASESLWKKANTESVKKDFLFGEKGIVFGLSSPELENAANIHTTAADDDEIDVDVQRVRLEAERAFFNHVLLSKPQPTISAAKRNERENHNVSRGFNKVIDSVTSRRELMFGDKIRKYIRSGKKKNLGDLLTSVNADPAVDGVLLELWSEAVAIINQKVLPDSRDSVTSSAFFVEKACDFLHKQYISHMTERVERNLEQAERGGVPGTKGLVEAYLKLSADDPNAEDGVVKGLPVWEVTYHCFRAGDIAAASDALAHLGSFPHAACLVQSLNHLVKHEKIDAEMKKKLKVEWRHNMNVTRDIYKRGLYAALLGADSPLSDSMENWLWFKLIVLRTDPQMTPALYAEVQKIISIDYGENYFMRDGEFHYYFTALWLSGQFERAIELLTNCGQMVEAVHLAILAHEMGYLRKTNNSSADLIVVDPLHPTHCSLNLARLVVSYTKEFELADPERAMDYCFLLKGFKTPGGCDVFEKAVSRAVYLMDDPVAISNLLGSLTDDGKRTRALIDDYVDDPSGVIESVALDTETGGNSLEAIRLYLLADRSTKAVQLLAAEFAEALRGRRDNAAALLEVASTYRNLLSRATPAEYNTLSDLVDIAMIMDACEKGKTEKVFKWTHDLRFLPQTPEAVPVVIGEFHMVPQRVREVLPDYCLAITRCMVTALKEARNEKYRKQVSAVVMYIAAVNCKFPQHITSEILKLQASVAI